MNSNHTVDELLNWLDKKSRTFGWGAIVAYDRRKANRLLEQIFIQRFTDGSYLPLISESISHGQYTVEHLSGLRLSVPMLSFQNADLGDSEASLTLDFVGGMILTEMRANGMRRIEKIQKVLPIGGPKLSMTLDLRRAQGNVGSGGEVIIDISQGDDFKADFVLGSLSPEEIGLRFKAIFSELEDSQKVFPLGRLDGELNGPLTPDSFEIRTMAAPGATKAGAENYGDGAVLLFVRLKGGAVGGYPGVGSDFMYLIPADSHGKEYSGTVLLASKLLVAELFKPQIEAQVGNGLKMMVDGNSSDLAIGLKASEGSYRLEDFDLKAGSGLLSLTAKSLEPMTFDFAGSDPFTVSSAGALLKFVWKGKKAFLFHFTRQDMGFDPEKEDSYVHFTHSLEFYLKANVDEVTGVVTFAPAPGGSSSVSVEKAPGEIDLYYTFDQAFKARLGDALNEMHDRLSGIDLPHVDTFLVRNLLFPGENALQLNDAHVPGDLALFGRIDPARTMAKISPLRPTIAANTTQQFTVEPALDGVQWSVQSTEVDSASIGTIDSKGLYKAPAEDSLPQGYLTVVVNAKGKLGGQDVSVSAMVSVLVSSVTVAPVFQSCDYDTKIELTSGTMQGNTPSWTLKNPEQGGRLEPRGMACTYTAGPLNTELGHLYLDTIVIKNPATNAVAEAHIVVQNRNPNVLVVISPSSKPETGEVQLMLDFGDGPEMPVEGDVFTALISGGGTLSPTGLYREAPGANGFAVISYDNGPGARDWRGFIVLPLPLALYADITRRFSNASDGTRPSRQP